MLQWYSLTRRFSVLRNSSGEPVQLDELRSRFAEQRARGSENKVSEEEEDMILEALGRLRGQGRPKPSEDRVLSGFSDSQDTGSRTSTVPSLAGGLSVRSNVTSATSNSVLHGSSSAASLSSTKGSQASRRMSNNLFGSSKFHDHSYVRNTQRRPFTTSTSSGRSGSVKHSDSSTSMSTITSSRVGPGNSASMYSDSQSLRPVTPDGSAYASSVPSSPNNTSYSRDNTSDYQADTKAGLPRALSPEVIGRASLALDEVIRELEEEGDDEIVMERSPISTMSPGFLTTTGIRNSNAVSVFVYGRRHVLRLSL